MLSKRLLFVLTVFCSLSAFANDAHRRAKEGKWDVVLEMLREGKVGINDIHENETLLDIAMLDPQAIDAMLELVALGALNAYELDTDAANEVHPDSPVWPRGVVTDPNLRTPYTGFAFRDTPPDTTIDGEESIPLPTEADDDDKDGQVEIIKILDFGYNPPNCN